MQGWFKVKRGIFQDPIIGRDAQSIAIWIYLLENMSFGEFDIMFSKSVITLKRGQMVTTLGEISRVTGVKVSKVNRVLKKLKSEKRIDIATDMQKSLITLGSEWFYIGDDEKGNEKRVKNERKTEQDRENEKEKSSKREKGKEKEIIKNVKNTNYYVKGCRNNLSYANECVENCQGVDFEKQLEIYDNGALNKESEQSPVAYDSCDSLVFKHYIKNTNQDEIDAMFERLWQAYPKKVGKRYARECFKRLKPTVALLDKMLLAIEKQRKSEAWKRDKGQYIPNPSTWINQGRWEDELEVSTHKLFENVDFGIEV